MPIPEADKHNFREATRAFKNGDIAILECFDKVDNRSRTILCIMQRDGEESIMFIPVAIMLDINDYGRLIPPEGTTESTVPGTPEH